MIKTSKQCAKCKEEKSLSDFHVLRKSKDGRQSRCKICALELARSWVQKNKDKLNSPSIIRSTSMGRQELHNSEFKIEQNAPIGDHANYDGDIVIADKPLNKDWADALLFNEEPVTIRIEPSSDKNAAGAHPVWVNGKGAEVFQNNQWMEIGYLPVGRTLTIKRKYVAVLASAKFDRITHEVHDETSERPNNKLERFTSSSVSFSVLEDANPKGRAWLSDLIRRNM